MGTYRKMAFTQGDRPVYQKESQASFAALVYLFYWPLAREWRIGNSHTAAAAAVRSGAIDAALCPNEVTSWYAAQGTSWIGSNIYPITVSAPTLPPVRADGNAAPLRAAALRRENGSCAQMPAMRIRDRVREKDGLLHHRMFPLHAGSLSALGCARSPRHFVRTHTH
jgi:hypothetical protein